MLDIREGQILVHPIHGPAVVAEIRMRKFGSTLTRYVELSLVGEDLRVSVPVVRVEALGIRAPFDADGLASFLQVLRGQSAAEERQWSRRFKQNQERISTGDTMVLAATVRDLTRRKSYLGISVAEKDQWRRALRPLASELMIVLDLARDEAEAMIEGVVLENGHRPRVIRGPVDELGTATRLAETL